MRSQFENTHAFEQSRVNSGEVIGGAINMRMVIVIKSLPYEGQEIT